MGQGSSEQEGVGALALEFTILTAARTSETLGAVPAEIDVDGAVWTVPPDRIKGGKEHRVPLCARALAIVKEAAALGGKFIFPGRKDGRPLSDMALLMLLERMGPRRNHSARFPIDVPRLGSRVH